MSINKGVAAVLSPGIVFFLTGSIGMNLVDQKRLEQPAIMIEVAPAADAASGAPKLEALSPIAPLLAKADVIAYLRGLSPTPVPLPAP